MVLTQRLRQLERGFEKAGIVKPPINLIVVCEEGVSEEQKRKAINEYEATNLIPNENGINTVYVRNERQ
jgi:hypothetical protein